MKKYLQDVFDIDQYISTGRNKIFLIAGVCSGKSTWVKDVLTKKGSVLFITSRKAKAESDIKNSTFSDVLKWNTEGNQTLITNAGLASRIENISINSSKDVDDFINHFDYIVVDEVHSVASDSMFAPSCFTLLSFIEYVANTGKPIICMTGTPEPIQKYFEEHEWLILNFLNICNYVHPSKIIMIQKHDVLGLIKRKSAENRKVIYFANRTDSIKNFCCDLLSNDVVTAKEIAVSVSKTREKKIFTKLKKALNNDDNFEQIQKASEETYKNIIENKRLPDGCKILFSTSTLKEGIDIDNERVTLFCENHVLSNLIQFFGRVRKGNTTIYVVEDSTDHKINHKELLYEYAIEAELAAANQFYKTKINVDGNPLVAQDRHYLIEHVSKNPYIYFDYLKNEFGVFHVKYHEEERLISKRFWKDDILEHCITYGIEPSCFDNKAFMCDVLDRMATKKTKYYEEKITIIQHALYTAYGIETVQPKKINELLELQNVPIRIAHGKGTKGEERHITYWRVHFIGDLLE